jgi:hypothetical protein
MILRSVPVHHHPPQSQARQQDLLDAKHAERGPHDRVERGPHERRRLRPVGQPGLVNLVSACSRPPA